MIIARVLPAPAVARPVRHSGFAVQTSPPLRPANQVDVLRPCGFRDHQVHRSFRWNYRLAACVSQSHRGTTQGLAGSSEQQELGTPVAYVMSCPEIVCS